MKGKCEFRLGDRVRGAWCEGEVVRIRKAKGTAKEVVTVQWDAICTDEPSECLRHVWEPKEDSGHEPLWQQLPRRPPHWPGDHKLLDRLARGLGYCWACKTWKPRAEFDTNKCGHKLRDCKACRPAKLTTQIKAARSAEKWEAPPAAKRAAAIFVALMDVPPHWKVPK